MRMRSSERKEKEEFVSKLGQLLKTDPRSDVDRMWYDVFEQWNYYEEYLYIRFNTGVVKKINVTSDSLYAILDEASKAVYV